MRTLKSTSWSQLRGRGWTRPSYKSGLAIAIFGDLAPSHCSQCVKGQGPFIDCRYWERLGQKKLKCINCEIDAQPCNVRCQHDDDDEEGEEEEEEEEEDEDEIEDGGNDYKDI